RGGDGAGGGRRRARPRRRSVRLLVGVVAEVVEVGDLLATPAELLLAMLEVPEVEEVPAREEPFFTEECQDLLADEEHAEAGLRLVELGLLAEVVEQRMVVKGGEERPVQRRGGGGPPRAPGGRPGAGEGGGKGRRGPAAEG